MVSRPVFRVLAGSLLTAGMLLLDREAVAHPESNPTLVNRYITATAHGNQLDVAVALLYGEHPAYELRRRFDMDKDGLLTSAEEAALRETMSGGTASWLTLRLDDEAAPFNVKLTVDLGSSAAVGPVPLVVEGRMLLPLKVASHVLELQAGASPERHGETEVTVALGPGWHLSGSRGPGHSAASPQASRSYKLVADGIGRDSVTFEFEPQTGTAPAATPGLWTAFAMAVAAAALLAWTQRRAKNARRAQAAAATAGESGTGS